jgi:hypothetical protein
MITQQIQPDGDENKSRWAEQSLRYRLLNGQHLPDVRKEIEAMFAKEIAADLEINPDLSRNPFLLIWQQLNVAYIEAPEVTVSDDPDVDLTPIITPKLWAQQMQTGLYTLAMNECMVRLDFRWWQGATEVSYRVVQPSVLVWHHMPGEPDRLGAVEELRQRDGKPTWDIWDIRDPSKPIFRIEKYDNGKRVDATLELAPDLVDNYPYTDTSGAPILPYVMYHSQVLSQLSNWQKGSELAAGSLRLAALYTHWGEGFTNAAHPQRYAIDLDTQAGTTRTIGGTAVDVVAVDRKSILKFNSKGPGGGNLGSFASGFDPLSSIEALKVFEQGLAVYAGLNPSDLQVTQGQSGYAIVVSRAGQRRAQKLVEPALRLADGELLATAARLANAYLGTSLPESYRSYSVSYRALQPTADELEALAKSLQVRIDMGVLSQLDAIRELSPEIESDEAGIRRLLRVRELEATLAAQATAEATGTDGTADAEVAAMAPAGEAENVQLTALNGAQVTAAQGIVQGVADGMLPRESGIQMLAAFFNLPITAAERIMGAVGTARFTSKTDET